ncbi:MAG: agmatinase [Ignavibacteriae bacterium]|nr:agmatinase [Ignavibacteriota bacterium]MCB9244201.1 agmatinase [Ignavibacteriales bacterium]
MKTLGIKKNFLAIEDKYSNYKDSAVAIASAPYEATTSYGKGTAKGPEAIIKASHYVEFFDEELNREFAFEKGIATLKPMVFGDKKGMKALGVIYKQVKNLIDDGKFVVTLGGEHSISTAPIQAHFDSYEDLSILHFDAHSDLRDKYEGSKYSHASFAARVSEFTTDITQVGIRAQCKEEYDFIKKKKIKTFYAYEIRDGKYGNDWQKVVISTLKKNVYITFDVDYLDPSVMPSTGTPEPMGFYWEETMKLFRLLGGSRRVVGFDVVELSPRKDFSFPDFLTAKLIYKMLNYFIR